MEVKELINLANENIDLRLVKYIAQAFDRQYAQALRIKGVSAEAFVTGMLVILDSIHKNGLPSDLEEIIHGEKV